jgi:hypothetical protein
MVAVDDFERPKDPELDTCAQAAKLPLLSAQRGLSRASAAVSRMGAGEA